MEPSFDIRGNLKPYKKVKLDTQEFRDTFVDSFDEDSTRHDILTIPKTLKRRLQMTLLNG